MGKPDFAMNDGQFLHTYPGYTLERMNKELDEDQYIALMQRIPHIIAMSPDAAVARSISKMF